MDARAGLNKTLMHSSRGDFRMCSENKLKDRVSSEQVLHIIEEEMLQLRKKYCDAEIDICRTWICDEIERII